MRRLRHAARSPGERPVLVWAGEEGDPDRDLQVGVGSRCAGAHSHPQSPTVPPPRPSTRREQCVAD